MDGGHISGKYVMRLPVYLFSMAMPSDMNARIATMVTVTIHGDMSEDSSSLSWQGFRYFRGKISKTSRALASFSSYASRSWGKL